MEELSIANVTLNDDDDDDDDDDDAMNDKREVVVVVVEEEELSLEEKVKELVRDDKLFAAVRMLKKESKDDDDVEKKDSFQQLLQLVEKSQEMMNIMKEDKTKDDGWKHVVKHKNENLSADPNNNNNNNKKKKDGEEKGKANIYCRTNEEHNELKVHITNPIHQCLLIPIISVLNESQLYHTWLPSWNIPPVTFGIKRVVKLKQIGRCSQIIMVTFDPPWPLNPREVVLRAVAIDDIDDNGIIFIKLDSVTEEEEDCVPVPENDNVVRLALNGGILLHKLTEEYIEIQFYGHIQSHISVPVWFYQFVVKTVIYTCWNLFLNVAIGIKKNSTKRKEHCQAIQEKWKDLYEWVELRTTEMMLQQQQQQPLDNNFPLCTTTQT